MNWYTLSKADDPQGIVTEERTGRPIAVTYDVKDAVLVAIAPRLLGTLKKIVEMYDDNPDDLETMDKCVTLARADLAEATEPLRKRHEKHHGN